MSKNENEVIRIKALNIMSAGENTPKALYEKLKEKLPYADRDAIKIEIRRLILEGIVDEKRYGERFIELCKGKMYGHRRIENELAAKKFSEKFMNDSAELILSDEEERALELATRKFDSLTDVTDKTEAQKQIQKVFAYMMRMGYDTDVIKRAFALYKENLEDEE